TCPRRGWKLSVAVDYPNGDVVVRSTQLPCRTGSPKKRGSGTLKPSIMALAATFVAHFDRAESAVAAGTGNNGRVDRNEWTVFNGHVKGRRIRIDGTELFRKVD